MDYQAINDNRRDVRNDAEALQNGSEQAHIYSANVRNGSEDVPKITGIRSEGVQNESEQKEIRGVSITKSVPNDAEVIANTSENIRNNSEEPRKGSEDVPNKTTLHSEETRNVSEKTMNNSPESFRTAPVCSVEHRNFTITVREAARIFLEAGVPRTERAITNWCNRNARGIIRLDCCYNEKQRKYYISPDSINRVIREERKKMQYIEYKDGGTLSAEAEELSEQVRNDRNEDSGKEKPDTGTNERLASSEVPHRSEQTTSSKETTREASGDNSERRRGQGTDTPSEDERAKLKELQIENYELRVQVEGQKHLIRQFDSLVDGERERHEREKLALVDRLTDARHEVGTLEQKLLQLEAPRGSIRDAETDPQPPQGQVNAAGHSEAGWQHQS